MDAQNYIYTKISPEDFYQKDNKKALESDELLLRQPKRSKKTKRVLNTLDTLISLFVVTPLIVGSWRGAWELMDIYGKYFPTVEGFLVANLIHIVFAFCQNIFHYLIIEQKYGNWFVKILNFLIVKCYSLIFAVISVLQFRNGWMIMDIFCGLTLTKSGHTIREGSSDGLWFTAVCVLILYALKGLNNITGAPFLIGVDVEDEIFLFRTRYFYKIGEKTFLYVLDCLFSVFVVGTLVVFVWRGGWIIVDILLFPDDEILSAWGSLVIGYTAVAMAFLLQPLMRYVCDRLTGSPRLLVADIFILFAFFGTVNVWRGIWNLLNLYFLPDNLELSCWITYWVSLIVLILLGCSNSLLVRGVFIDAEEPAGKCVVFPCYYLRVIFHEDKTKKLHLTSLSFDNKAQNKMDIENNHVNISTISTTMKENHSVLVA